MTIFVRAVISLQRFRNISETQVKSRFHFIFT